VVILTFIMNGAIFGKATGEGLRILRLFGGQAMTG
jgi:hypothetical protein